MAGRLAWRACDAQRREQPDACRPEECGPDPQARRRRSSRRTGRGPVRRVAFHRRGRDQPQEGSHVYDRGHRPRPGRDRSTDACSALHQPPLGGEPPLRVLARRERMRGRDTLRPIHRIPVRRVITHAALDLPAPDGTPTASPRTSHDTPASRGRPPERQPTEPACPHDSRP